MSRRAVLGVEAYFRGPWTGRFRRPTHSDSGLFRLRGRKSPPYAPGSTPPHPEPAAWHSARQPHLQPCAEVGGHFIVWNSVSKDHEGGLEERHTLLRGCPKGPEARRAKGPEGQASRSQEVTDKRPPQEGVPLLKASLVTEPEKFSRSRDAAPGRSASEPSPAGLQCPSG